MLMNRLVVMLNIIFTLCACSGVSISNGRTKVTVEKDKPFCDTQKVDPNCKIENKIDKL